MGERGSEGRRSERQRRRGGGRRWMRGELRGGEQERERGGGYIGWHAKGVAIMIHFGKQVFPRTY